MMENLKKAYRLKAESVIKQMSKRKIEGFYCDSKEEAVQKAMDLMKENCSVTWGGSVTVSDIGIKNRLNEKNLKIIDRDQFKGQDRINAMKEAFHADYYLTSANAITQDGMLVNIDGNGNRVAAMCFGPEYVIVIAGINKITKDVQCAIDRIRNSATAPNAIRLNVNSPCAQTGVCSDCLSDECICGQILVTRYNRFPGRIKVIIVGENLGY
jgi:hypothetical protein